MKKHLPPKEIGNRACEEFNAYVMKNGLTVKAASEKIGIERKSSIAWSKGGAPCAFALAQMAKVGIDVQYIITGKRAKFPCANLNVSVDPDGENTFVAQCSACGSKMYCKANDSAEAVETFKKAKFCCSCGSAILEVIEE